jgi:hypothetical protein
MHDVASETIVLVKGHAWRESALTRLSQLGRRMSDFRVFCVEKASQYNER